MEQNKVANAAVIFIAIVLLAIVLKEMQSFLRPFTIAVLLTFLLMPVLRFSKRYKIPFFLTLGGIFVVLISSVVVLSGVVAVESRHIYDSFLVDNNKLNETIEKISEIGAKLNTAGIDLDIDEAFKTQNISAAALRLIGPVMQAIIAIISELFIAVIFLIFLVPSHEFMLKNIEQSIKKGNKNKFKEAILDVEKSIKDYLSTKTLISLGTAITSAIILILFDAKFAIIIAILIFLFNYIPNIGSFVAVFLALAAYYFQAGFGLSLFLLFVLLTIVQLIFGNYLEPKFAGAKLKLSPVVIVLSLFIWYWIWGVVGMMVAIPITSIIKIILSHTQNAKDLAKLMS